MKEDCEYCKGLGIDIYSGSTSGESCPKCKGNGYIVKCDNCGMIVNID